MKLVEQIWLAFTWVVAGIHFRSAIHVASDGKGALTMVLTLAFCVHLAIGFWGIGRWENKQ